MKILSMIRWHQIAIAFLIGCVLGISFGHWQAECRFKQHHMKRDGMKHHMMGRMEKDLCLTAGQKEKISAIFEAARPRMDALQTEVRPKFEALRNETQAEIRKILTPEQQQRFDAMNERMEKRMQKHGKDMLPPPPPGGF